MYWSAEEILLAVTGALFFVIVASSFFARVQVAPTSRLTFAIGAVVFVGAAVILARIEEVRYPGLLWLLPLVPMIVIGVLLRDAIAGPKGRATRAVGRVAPDRDADAPRRAAFFPPTEDLLTVGEGGDGRVRELASDPEATAQELADIAFTRPHLRAAVARNPATPANVLEWLASQGDPVVQAAIVSRSSAVSR